MVKPEHAAIRMVGYGRVSTDQEKQLDSLENQILFFSEYAGAKGYQLVHVYADEGISGKQLKNRDQFIRMLNDGAEGQFDMVVVKDVSRFARNTVDLLTAVRQLKARGINVVFVNNNQQTLGESEFVLTMFAAIAQEESANLSRRVRFGKEINAKKGRVPREILGYDKLDNFTLKINEAEAELVRRIYRLYLSGQYGMAAIADLLGEEGFRTRNGCPYTEGYIRRVLTNPIYCGELVNHKTVTTDYINGLRMTLPEEEQYRHCRPELAIVDRETFARVQHIRQERRRMQTGSEDRRRRHTSRYLFSGVVRCAECGRTMFHQEVRRKNGGADRYWRCPGASAGGERCANRRQIRNDVLERALSGFLTQCVGEGDAFAGSVWARREELAAEDRSAEESLTEKCRSADRLHRQRERYIEMCSGGILSLEELKRYTREIDRRLEQLDLEIHCLGRERTAEPGERLNECREEVARFLSLRSAENRDIKELLSHIEVGKDRQVTFVFRSAGNPLQQGWRAEMSAI